MHRLVPLVFRSDTVDFLTFDMIFSRKQLFSTLFVDVQQYIIKDVTVMTPNNDVTQHRKHCYTLLSFVLPINLSSMD